MTTPKKNPDQFIDTVMRSLVSLAFVGLALFFAYLGAIQARDWVASLSSPPVPLSHLKGALAFCALCSAGVVLARAIGGK